VSESERRFDAYWETLSELDRERFDQEAVAKAEGFDQRFYTDGKGRDGSLFRTVQRRILMGFLKDELLTVSLAELFAKASRERGEWSGMK
jgi:hypothetical protein